MGVAFIFIPLPVSMLDGLLQYMCVRVVGLCVSHMCGWCRLVSVFVISVAVCASGLAMCAIGMPAHKISEAVCDIGVAVVFILILKVSGSLLIGITM